MLPLLRYTLDLFLSETAAPAGPASGSATRVAAPYQPGDLLQNTLLPAAFNHPQANRTVRLGDAHIAYAFARARRRTIGFVVGPEGLVVRAPRWTPMGEVDAALQEKSAWILRKLQEMQDRARRQGEARIEWRDGARLPFLGRVLELRLDAAHTVARSGAKLQLCPQSDADQLHLAVAASARPEQLRDAVQAWLMRQARAHFVLRLNHFAPQLQVQWSRLRLSNAATRWGSASADGTIRLNWRLVHFGTAVVDYVVVHELSHLRVMDHSPRFWNTVASVLPEYAAVRAELKDGAVPRW